jgi:GNAT superfamily N-acetyltransferase
MLTSVLLASMPEQPAAPGGEARDAPEGWLRQADLTAAHLQACRDLDQASLGGLWSEAQWLRELEDGRRPGVGLFLSGELLALATGWLVVDELHITAVAVAPAWRRRGLGRQVLTALLRRARGLGAGHGVLIPQANVEHLMLREEVVEASAAGVTRLTMSTSSDATDRLRS